VARHGEGKVCLARPTTPGAAILRLRERDEEPPLNVVCKGRGWLPVVVAQACGAIGYRMAMAMAMAGGVSPRLTCAGDARATGRYHDASRVLGCGRE